MRQKDCIALFVLLQIACVLFAYLVYMAIPESAETWVAIPMYALVIAWVIATPAIWIGGKVLRYYSGNKSRYINKD